MTQKIRSTNQGGRPPKYSVGQVRDAVGALFNSGKAVEAIDATMVKSILVSDFQVSNGIDVRSLEPMVEHVRQEVIEAERNALLKALPASTAPAVEALIKSLGQDLMVFLARARSEFQAEASREGDELRRDKQNANWRITELETQLRDSAGQIAQITRERDAALAQATEMMRERDDACSSLATRERDAGMIGQLMAELKNPSIRSDIRDAIVEIAQEKSAPEQVV